MIDVTLNVDLSELTDMTDAVQVPEDELIILDNGADRRKLISEIYQAHLTTTADLHLTQVTLLALQQVTV